MLADLGTHLIVDCDTTGRADPALVGEKAAQLLDLYELSQCAGFRVPRFCVLPASVLRHFYRREEWTTRLDYEPLPQPHGIPPDVLARLLAFPAFARAPISACLARLERPAMLRTSLVRSAGDTGTGYGINATALLDADQASAFPYTPAVPELIAALYKAYTTWDSDDGHSWRNREAGIVFMEAVPFSCIGAAYVEADKLTVEVDVKRPPRRIQRVLDPHLVGDHRDVPGLVPYGKLLRACREIWKYRCGTTGVVEVEFGVGLDGELFVVQARELAGSMAGAFHSVGEVTGRVLDLRQIPRGPDAAREVLSDVHGQVLLVRRCARRTLDAFALAWLWKSGTQRSNRPAAVVLEDPGNPGTGPGFRNHLAHAFMARRTVPFLAQVAHDQWPDGMEEVMLRSDGSTLDVRAP
ncbi:hypothetical protein [Streptomyces sp. NPDC001401]|uniref:hypothetical protein n=1 Tax=Streptomyces sp. NPDC001401 TaxID=3364570 RepID=UPI003677547B